MTLTDTADISFSVRVGVNMGKGQMCNFDSKCKHILYNNKWYKSQGVMHEKKSRLTVADYYRTHL